MNHAFHALWDADAQDFQNIRLCWPNLHRLVLQRWPKYMSAVRQLRRLQRLGRTKISFAEVNRYCASHTCYSATGFNSDTDSDADEPERLRRSHPARHTRCSGVCSLQSLEHEAYRHDYDMNELIENILDLKEYGSGSKQHCTCCYTDYICEDSDAKDNTRARRKRTFNPWRITSYDNASQWDEKLTSESASQSDCETDERVD